MYYAIEYTLLEAYEALTSEAGQAAQELRALVGLSEALGLSSEGAERCIGLARQIENHLLMIERSRR